MSRPLYNPYSSGNQNSNQGQYGLPTQAERDPQRTSSQLGPRFNFSSSGASSTIPGSSRGSQPSQMSHSMTYRPEQSRAIMDEDLERSIDMHISRAREEVSVLGKQVQQPVDQGTCFAATQRDGFRSSGSGMASYQMSSTSLQHRESDVGSGSSSLDWSSNYKRPTADNSKFYSSSASANYSSSSDSMFNAPGKSEHDKQSIPGLGDYDCPVPNKSTAPAESSRPKYTSESAANILLHFGLEKEDLEHLISYPEDQITPANLPFILRQIRIQKAKRTTTGVQAKPYPEAQPTKSVSGMDSHNLSTSGAAGTCQNEISSAVLQPSKVIDYGHVGKYIGGVGDDSGKTSGSNLLMDTRDSSRYSQEPPLQKNTAEVKSSTLGSSHEQASPVASLSASYSSVSQSRDPMKQSLTQPNQTCQSILSSFLLPKKDIDIRGLKPEAFKAVPSKDTDIRGLKPEAFKAVPSKDTDIRGLKPEAFKAVPSKDTDIRGLKPEAFKAVPLKEPEAVHQSTLKPQPPFSSVVRGIHPSRPGLVLVGSNDNSGTKDQNKSQNQGSAVAKPMKNLQAQQQKQKEPKEQQSKQQTKQQTHQTQKQPVSQTGQEVWPPVFSAMLSVPPAPLIPSITNASKVLAHPAFTAGYPQPAIIPPALSQPVQSPMSFTDMMMLASRVKPPTKEVASKRLPTMAMMHDYAAASPRIFPHTCSLCNTECTRMKDWISHQNTSHHLGNCKLLRQRYPEWDGDIALGPRAAGKDAKPSASSSAQSSQHRHQKTRHGSRSSSRSRSSSPRRHHGSESRREKRSSRSRSPRGSRYARRSRSRSHSPWYDRPTSSRYWSHSRSPERRSSPRRRDERRSTPRRSPERSSSPRRRERRRSTPRRSLERSFSPRRRDNRRSSRERSLSPRRRDDRRLSPRRRDERRLSPRRRDERRSFVEGSSQQKKSSSSERLAMKLLETSAAQSLSQQSDLEAVVKTLAPALLAELAKMKSSSPSSSSSSSSSKLSVSRPSAGGKQLSSSDSTLSSSKKLSLQTAVHPLSVKPVPATMVKLEGIRSSLSHNDVVNAVEHFGKTKSVVLFRSRLQAVVCFEKKEDAEKLKRAKSLDVKGLTITVVRNEETEKEQKKPPQKKPGSTPSVSTPPSATTTTTTTAKKPFQSTPNISEANKATTGKLSTPSAAKGSVKGLKTVTKPKVLVSKAKNVSMKPGPKTGTPKGTVKKAVMKPKTSLGSKPTAPEVHHVSGDSKQQPEISEISVKEPVDVLKETPEVVKTADAPVPEPEHQAKLAEDAEPMELGETGVEVAEPMEDESRTEVEGEQEATADTLPEDSADKPSDDQPPTSTVETCPTETSVTISPLVQQSTVSEAAEPIAQEPETKTEASEMQQQVAGCPAEAAVEEKLPGGGSETDALQKDPVTAEETQTNEASARDASESTAAATSEQQLEASTPSTTALNPLTIEEMIEKHLHPNRISNFSLKAVFSPTFFQKNKLVTLSLLPTYYEGCYTEEDVANVLVPFGFQHKEDSIYVVPQACMAFAIMPTEENVQQLIQKSVTTGITFKGCVLFVRAVCRGITMAPLGFYQSLMRMTRSPVDEDGQRIVFIKNISQSEARSLREDLKQVCRVRNYLPLLQKVFMEFESDLDLDLFGVWNSLQKQPPRHEVHRLRTPSGDYVPLPVGLPENVLPDSWNVVTGATIPPITTAVPQGSISPFWVTLRTKPFLFPTTSPWFIIPDYVTITGKDDMEKVSGRDSMSPTIMLTGLPSGSYKHEDVAVLVWRHFPKRDLQSLYYNVTVLPLQRRAFVFFADWTSCCDFVQDHIANPVSVGGCNLNVHVVLVDMKPETSEELMYQSLMKWSNAGVPEPESLEERLLCVEISETTVDIFKLVMEVVDSIAPFVSFLPLANRMCVEMADSSGVMQVMEKHKNYSPDCSDKQKDWFKVQRFETLKNLKQRLQDPSDITINLKPDTQADPTTSELPDNGSQPALQTSGSAMSEPIAPGPRATTSSDVATKKVENPGSVIPMASPTSSTSTADVACTSAVTVGKIETVVSSRFPSARAIIPERQLTKLPKISTNVFNVLTETVHQHRLTRGNRSKKKKKNPSKNVAEEPPQTMDQVDFTDDTPSSDAYLFDELSFNMDDFVTVDEVGDDTEDTNDKTHSFPPSTSREKRDSQSTNVSSGGKQTSTSSLKDSKSSASSSSSSSKSTKGLSSSSTNSERQRDSSQPTKSPTKPSSSDSVSKAPCSSSLVSTSQKTQPRKIEPQAKASNAVSFSTACEKQKITSAATFEAITGTYLEAAKATKGAVATSDHKVSVEGSATKTVESETKIESLSEMHPPPQGHGVELSQAQALEFEFNINPLKDQKKSKEEGKEDDVDKLTEDDEDINSENYQILDSIDQTDEHIDDGDQDRTSETQLTAPQGGQALHEESYQVLDSVDDEGKACPQENNEMEVEGFCPVPGSVKEEDQRIADNRLVQEDSSTVKQLPEKLGSKDQETTSKDPEYQFLHARNEQAPMDEGVGKEMTQKEEKEVKGKSCKTGSVEDPDGRIPNEDQPLQDSDNKNDLKDPDSDVAEQETFEILDSIDDQTVVEDEDQKLETPTDQITKEDVRPIEVEEDMYQVIDSLEDEPTSAVTNLETDNEENRNKIEEATGPSRRSSPTMPASKREEKEKSPKKQDRTVKKYATRTKTHTAVEKIKKCTEEVEYKIVDSVEEEQIQDVAITERTGRRRSARGKKEEKLPVNITEASEHLEEATYKVLDSVEDEIADDQPTIMTRSTRGKRGRTSKKDASNEKTKQEDMPRKRRYTPSRESQEQSKERTLKKESTPTQKGDIVTPDLSSMAGEVVNNDQTPTGPKRKRGRPKKVKTVEKDMKVVKDTTETVADEEEVTYQIIDSVEEETVGDQLSTGSTKNEEEEEPMYQIVDSLDDDQEELTATEVSDRGNNKNSNESPARQEVSPDDIPTCGVTDVFVEKESLYKVVDASEEVQHDPSAPEGSGTKSEEGTAKKDSKKEDNSTTKSQRNTVTSGKEKTKNNTMSTLVNLDEVSEEEEDYPDDAAEEEELRKKQAAAKKKQSDKEQEARRTREREETERTRRCRSSSSSSSRGGVDRGGMRRPKKVERPNEEKLEVDTKELVTLDEVGADEAEGEKGPKNQEWDEEITEGDLQTLITLDEFIGEEEEDGNAEQRTLETRPLHQEDESVDSLNPETLVTLDEAGDDDEEKPDQQKTSRSAKRKCDQDTEESMNFVTVDEVGEGVEEEEEEEKKKAVTTRTRGQAKKRTRQTPVRKSTRRKKASSKDALQPSPVQIQDPPALSSDDHKTKAEVEAANQVNFDAAIAGQELLSEQPEERTQGCAEEGCRMAAVKAMSKLRRDPVGPEAKRSRSQSPCVTSDFKLPAFKPNNPLGQEFVVPKSGYFCNLCQVFYLNEGTAKDVHCSSQRHYNNLKKHYQKQSRSSELKSTQGSISD